MPANYRRVVWARRLALLVVTRSERKLTKAGRAFLAQTTNRVSILKQALRGPAECGAAFATPLVVPRARIEGAFGFTIVLDDELRHSVITSASAHLMGR